MAIAKLLALNANAVISTVIFETQNYSKLIKVFSSFFRFTGNFVRNSFYDLKDEITK